MPIDPWEDAATAEPATPTGFLDIAALRARQQDAP